MSDNSPCYGDGHGCSRRTAICHAQCREYHDWVEAQRRKPKRPPKGEQDADAVLTSRAKRQATYKQVKYQERRRNR